jgi:hypothetical protein
MNRLPGWCLAGLFVLAAGCGKDANLPRTYPVSGKAFGPDGKPLTSGQVQFQHATDLTITVVGDVGSDGSYSLRTIAGKRTLSGAPEGEYTVTIALPIPPGEHAAPRPITFAQPFRVEAKESTIDLRPGR